MGTVAVWTTPALSVTISVEKIVDVSCPCEEAAAAASELEDRDDDAKDEEIGVEVEDGVVEEEERMGVELDEDAAEEDVGSGVVVVELAESQLVTLGPNDVEIDDPVVGKKFVWNTTWPWRVLKRCVSASRSFPARPNSPGRAAGTHHHGRNDLLDRGRSRAVGSDGAARRVGSSHTRGCTRANCRRDRDGRCDCRVGPSRLGTPSVRESRVSVFADSHSSQWVPFDVQWRQQSRCS